MKRSMWFGLIATLATGTAHAASQEVPMNLVSAEGVPKAIGTITVNETPYGLLFTPNLKSLPAGMHGFHVHENGSCEAGMKDGVKGAALAAGDIWTRRKPASTWAHMPTGTWGICRRST